MDSMYTSPEALLEYLETQGIKYLSFCFTDMFGAMHNITYALSHLTADIIQNGISFDGSSIEYWKGIEASDTLLIPDINAVYIDPFTTEPCARIFCNVWDPIENSFYSKDPRNIAISAISYAKASGIADSIYFGPELEFFVFDKITYGTDAYSSFYKIEGEENPALNAVDFSDRNNLGYRPNIKGGYAPLQPVDSLFDLRAEICSVLDSVGVNSTIHHHEVAANQCEIGFLYSDLLTSADNIQKAKYVIKNVAASYSKSATFMPKPIYSDNGSGMHLHQSAWKNGQNLFFDPVKNNQLSDIALFYLGGIIKHAKSINAFTNPTVNSYKRLVPGFEAPTKLAYSSNNRSAAIRIPYSSTANAKRIEVRFPDPAANPYLALAAMLMAGLDGIKNKIHPGEAVNHNLYALSDAESKKIPSVSQSLEESLSALEKDNAFLTVGGVFSSEMISSYIKAKTRDVMKVKALPHPMEFHLYYGC